MVGVNAYYVQRPLRSRAFGCVGQRDLLRFVIFIASVNSCGRSFRQSRGGASFDMGGGGGGFVTPFIHNAFRLVWRRG